MEILIYGFIGTSWFEEGVDQTKVVGQIQAATEGPILVRINSPGGNAFDGMTIYNALRAVRDRVTVRIEGMAGSAASIIAMAGSKIEICRPGYLFIHQAESGVMGNADEFRAEAATLDKLDLDIAGIYAERAGGTPAEWLTRMKAESWINTQEAIDLKLADSIFGESPLTNEKAIAMVRAVKAACAIKFAPAKKKHAATAAKAQVRSTNMAMGTCTLADGTAGECDEAICTAAGGTFEPAAEPDADAEAAKKAADDAAAAVAQNNATPKPATIAEIKALSPSAPPAFVLNCAERGMTAGEVQTANIARLTAENVRLAKELAKPKPAAASTVINVVSGGDPGDEDDGGLKARWDGDAALRESFKNKFENFARWDKYKDRVRVNGKPVTEFV